VIESWVHIGNTHSVEVSVGFLKESGQKLTEVSPRGINGKKFSTRQNLSNNLSPYLELG
jgi:hypothetical protein